MGWPAEWISVDILMPIQHIRVWGSIGHEDIGEDVYFGHKSALLTETFKNGFADYGQKCWRMTATEKPVTEVRHGKDIKFWIDLPDSPPKEASQTQIGSG